MADHLTESSTPPTLAVRQIPFREDCWTEEATATLVEAWGRRYMDLNRGNLRQKDWQEVADEVNNLHGHTKKTHRTDVQCKNRIDTLKKKYKTEKAKIVDTDGVYVSPWPFFTRLDFLIGSKGQVSKSAVVPVPVQVKPMSLPSPPMAVPLAYRKPASSYAVATPFVLPQKRPNPAVEDASYFKRNYSAMAAAAAAEDEDDDESEPEEEVKVAGERGREVEDGLKGLASAIDRFGDVYEKVENMKHRQILDLEKQRMQFAKDLEVQRMQLLMDMQLQFERVKRTKRSGSSDDMYS